MTFLGLLVVSLSLLCFTSDMDRYAKLQLHMKALAEDCAAASVLFTDPEAYSRGLIVFSREDALRCAEFMAASAQNSSSSWLRGTLSVDISLFDDEKGYEGLAVLGIEEERPCGAAVVTWEGEDIFRLPFFRVTSAFRTAVYEWVE